MKSSPPQNFEDQEIFLIGSTKSAGRFLVLSVIFFSLFGQIYACEPAVPLGQMALFPGGLASSGYLLIATIVIKTAAFVFLEKSLPWWKAILFILLANFLTTIIGVISIIPLSMIWCLPLFILSGLLAYIPGKGLAQRYFSEEKQRSATNIIALFMTLISFASGISFFVAQTAIVDGRFEAYWGWKIVCVYLGLIFGILITIFYEEWIVARLARKKDIPTPFLTSVTRANLIALLFMMIVTAIIVIPEKIKNQDYGSLRQNEIITDSNF